MHLMLAVAVGAFVFLAAACVLGLLSAKEMRDTIARQFNDEQMAVALYVKRHIEQEVGFLKKETALLKNEISEPPFDHAHRDKKIKQSLYRLLDVGVGQIEIVDLGRNESTIHTLLKPQGEKRVTDSSLFDAGQIQSLGDKDVWLSAFRLKSNAMMLTIGTSLEKPSHKLILLHVNITWFLSRFLRDIRSGKTGYAWIIDENGTIIYHPDRVFIGKNAFRIRKTTYPDISFAKINFIQKEKMLKGFKGTGWYASGWHRGITGEIEKLIAYCPIRIADIPPRKWSVAVGGANRRY